MQSVAAFSSRLLQMPRSLRSETMDRRPARSQESSSSSSSDRHHLPRTRPPSLSRSNSLIATALDPAALLDGEHRDAVKLNDVVGSGISGILHKWVNFGKGWRPRWFVLQDGVLSYFKIHGPGKIVVSQETEKGSKVIGEESIKRVCSRRRGQSHSRRKPLGEIHLKVIIQFNSI